MSSPDDERAEQAGDDDPRLLSWLERTERALAAGDADAVAAIDAAVTEREALRADLEGRPPAAPSRELALRLQRAEEAFAARAEALRDRLGADLARLRDQRRATRGYRPARGTRPAFVSRSV